MARTPRRGPRSSAEDGPSDSPGPSSDNAEGPVYFSTHKAARLLGVSLPTVVNWTNSGLLEAHRTPGGHRRISKEALVRFAEANHYPLPTELRRRKAGPRRVLVVDAEPDFCDLIREAIELQQAGWVARTADSAFKAGLEMGRFQPEVVVMDMALPELDPVRLAERLAEDADLARVHLVGLASVPDPHLRERAQRAGYAAVRPKSVSLDELLVLIADLLRG